MTEAQNASGVGAEAAPAATWGHRLVAALSASLPGIWLGAQLAIGYLVVPVLFAQMPKEEAGRIAGLLFAPLNVLALVCLGIFLVAECGRLRRAAWRNGACWLAAVLIVLTLTQHFGLHPMMAALKQQAAVDGGITHSAALYPAFARLHGISSALFLLQSLLGLALCVRILSERVSTTEKPSPVRGR